MVIGSPTPRRLRFDHPDQGAGGDACCQGKLHSEGCGSQAGLSYGTNGAVVQVFVKDQRRQSRVVGADWRWSFREALLAGHAVHASPQPSPRLRRGALTACCSRIVPQSEADVSVVLYLRRLARCGTDVTHRACRCGSTSAATLDSATCKWAPRS